VARPAGKEVKAMDRESVVPRPKEHVWETPAAEEIRVSAEATMYMGAWEDQDWM
jgi:coenzyme PQQ precursor peptide PqqA